MVEKPPPPSKPPVNLLTAVCVWKSQRKTRTRETHEHLVGASLPFFCVFQIATSESTLPAPKVRVYTLTAQVHRICERHHNFRGDISSARTGRAAFLRRALDVVNNKNNKYRTTSKRASYHVSTYRTPETISSYHYCVTLRDMIYAHILSHYCVI